MEFCLTLEYDSTTEPGYPVRKIKGLTGTGYADLNSWPSLDEGALEEKKRNIFLKRKNGATFLGISQEAIGRYQIALPPHSEQIAISTFLDNETTKLETLTSESKTAITLLQERRTALISAAVTGKIDVRSLVADKS